MRSSSVSSLSRSSGSSQYEGRVLQHRGLALAFFGRLRHETSSEFLAAHYSPLGARAWPTAARVRVSPIQLSNSPGLSVGARQRPYSLRRRVRRSPFFSVPSKMRGMARQVAQPLFFKCRTPSREHGRLSARHLCVLLPAPSLTSATRGPSVSQAPGRQPVVAAGRSPGAARVRAVRKSSTPAGAAPCPTIKTPQMTPLTLSRMDRNIFKYRIKVKRGEAAVDDLPGQTKTPPATAGFCKRKIRRVRSPSSNPWQRGMPLSSWL